MSKIDISVIIPCYNEEENIEKLLLELLQDSFLKECEIILVDDGSTDQTSSIIKKFTAVKFLKHPTNFGYGQALVTGMRSANCSNVVWMDGDGQHQIKDVVKVSKALLPKEIDYVIGERGASSHQEKSRLTGKFFLKVVLKMSGVKSITDFNSGLRGFKTKLILKYMHLLKGGFGASTTTTLIMDGRNYHGKLITITTLKRGGQSSLNQIRDGMRTLLLITRATLLFRPLRFFLSISCLFLFTGITYGIFITLKDGTGFPVFGAMLVLTGVNTLLLGLISDQISQMRLEHFE